jgi:hypothetical protein
MFYLHILELHQFFKQWRATRASLGKYLLPSFTCQSRDTGLFFFGIQSQDWTGTGTGNPDFTQASVKIAHPLSILTEINILKT